jgi:hypothetical protein
MAKRIPTQVPVKTEPTNDEIARRAYELFEQRGRVDGHDREDWFQAERELTAGDSDVAA